MSSSRNITDNAHCEVQFWSELERRSVRSRVQLKLRFDSFICVNMELKTKLKAYINIFPYEVMISRNSEAQVRGFNIDNIIYIFHSLKEDYILSESESPVPC